MNTKDKWIDALIYGKPLPDLDLPEIEENVRGVFVDRDPVYDSEQFELRRDLQIDSVMFDE